MRSCIPLLKYNIDLYKLAILLNLDCKYNKINFVNILLFNIFVKNKLMIREIIESSDKDKHAFLCEGMDAIRFFINTIRSENIKCHNLIHATGINISTDLIIKRFIDSVVFRDNNKYYLLICNEDGKYYFYSRREGAYHKYDWGSYQIYNFNQIKRDNIIKELLK